MHGKESEVGQRDADEDLHGLGQELRFTVHVMAKVAFLE